MSRWQVQQREKMAGMELGEPNPGYCEKPVLQEVRPFRPWQDSGKRKEGIPIPILRPVTGKSGDRATTPLYSKVHTPLHHEIQPKNGLLGYHRLIRHKRSVILLLGLGVLIMGLVSVSSGSSSVSTLDVLRTFLGTGSEKASIVIWRMRMPRVVTAILAGAGLAVSGCVMQNNLKNPLASPATLGVSNAAAFGANIAIIFLGAGTAVDTAGDMIAVSNPYLVTVVAFACAMGATLTILALGKIRGFSPQAVVLAGVALGSLFSAGTALMQYFASDIRIAAAVFWTFGDLGRTSWKEVLIILAIVSLASIQFVRRRWDYNAMDNGEETARSLGVNSEKLRFFSLLTASLVTAVTVSFLGIIGFIGLISPQVMRRILGSDHRFLIPASMLAGAFLLLVSDTMARTVIAPAVLPVGALTSLLGAPLFIYLQVKGVNGRVRR